MKQSHANYGLDAPDIIKKFVFVIGVLAFFTIVVFFVMPSGIWKYLTIVSLIFTIISFLYPVVAIIAGSYFFKFAVRDELINKIPLRGNEIILDAGCGSGLLLIGLAKKITTGKVIGIDIWNSKDQTNNAQQETIKNAEIEEVLDSVEVITADMRTIPFQDAYFDVATSSWAIHNISDTHERSKALQEIMRVLKPGGYIALADIQYTQEYYTILRQARFTDLVLIGPRYTFGNQTFILIGKK